MPGSESLLTVERLLTGLSDLEVRELCLGALRVWRKARPGQDNFALHGELGLYIVPLLSARRGESGLDANDLKEVFIQARSQPWMTGVVEFLVWFTRAGLAIPLGSAPNDFAIRWRLTRAGGRLLDRPDDHPLLPGAIDRTCSRCAGLPAEVGSLLADARTCVDHGLLRPSVVMMGVAYEVAIEAIADSLITRGLLQSQVADQSAARRLAAIRAELNGALPGNTSQERDDRFATGDALDFANALRRRRNDASHTTPTYGFEDREEAEELLVSALRHLPNLWRLH